MKFNYSLFIGLIVASQMAHGSAAAPAKSVAKTETAADKRLRARAAWFKVLSQIYKKKLDKYRDEADAGLEVVKLKRRNGELAVIAGQVRTIEELLQLQRAANNQLRTDLSIAASNIKKLEAVNKKLNETMASELKKKLDEALKEKGKLEKEKRILLDRLATYSPRAKQVTDSLTSSASQSRAAAEDLP